MALDGAFLHCILNELTQGDDGLIGARWIKSTNHRRRDCNVPAYERKECEAPPIGECDQRKNSSYKDNTRESKATADVLHATAKASEWR